MRKGMEDWEFWIRFLDRNSVVYQIPEQLFNYRIKESSRNVEAKKELTLFEIELYVLSKHKEKYSSMFGTPICYLGDALRFKRKYYGIWYKRLWYGCARCLATTNLKSDMVTTSCWGAESLANRLFLTPLITDISTYSILTFEQIKKILIIFCLSQHMLRAKSRSMPKFA